MMNARARCRPAPVDSAVMAISGTVLSAATETPSLVPACLKRTCTGACVCGEAEQPAEVSGHRENIIGHLRCDRQRQR
ncbi:hypothetical protein BAUCODRAFT_221456 [Baudoinia panamericana UAMH 10762]|uniref:Uncharacterized protein n=1 Tax=Baudoinia panamericana (strain UAMH 10762) TaxID=717646 RepID=M2N5T0_BAUPA|nr:uncharacterized protein BAUCODRAFT_221456 [Baudoinia panamericana UAMH 10762]EMC94125.1 hypothetical protein BAUCODRAFT_221456 [Baudoinia panamericana UAMH 10762]